jgi:hypothetical protein
MQAAPISSILCVPSGVMVSGDSDVAAFEHVYTAQTNALLQEPVEVLQRIEHAQGYVEESVLKLSHTEQIDWLLPGVKITNKYIVVPLVCFLFIWYQWRISFPRQVTIVRYLDNNAVSKRLYWDQASVLKQLGILPSTMHCRASRSEVTLPVLDARIAKPLTAFEAMPVSRPLSAKSDAAGLSSHQANSDRTPMKSRQDTSSMSDIMAGTSLADHERPMSRSVRHPSDSDIFSTESLPLRTSIPIDPRRYKTQIDLSNGELASAPENDVHHKKHFAGSNNSSQFSLSGEFTQPAHYEGHNRMGAQSITQETQEEVNVYHGRKLFAGSNDSHFSFDGSLPGEQAPAVNNTRKQFNGRRDPNARSDEHLMGTRPSSRYVYSILILSL